MSLARGLGLLDDAREEIERGAEAIGYPAHELAALTKALMVIVARTVMDGCLNRDLMLDDLAAFVRARMPRPWDEKAGKDAPVCHYCGAEPVSHEGGGEGG